MHIDINDQFNMAKTRSWLARLHTHTPPLRIAAAAAAAAALATTEIIRPRIHKLVLCSCTITTTMDTQQLNTSSSLSLQAAIMAAWPMHSLAVVCVF